MEASEKILQKSLRKRKIPAVEGARLRILRFVRFLFNGIDARDLLQLLDYMIRLRLAWRKIAGASNSRMAWAMNLSA